MKQISFNIVLEVWDSAITQEKDRKNPNWKRSKAITVDDMILYVENPKDTTRKLLEHFSVFG